MVRARRRLGIFLVMILMLTLAFNYPSARAVAKTIIPEIQFVSEPVTEYYVGDRVRFDISAPNYGGRVQYRVLLWNDNTKSAYDLWNPENGYPDRYYTKWQPYGNNVFTLGWPIFEPGSYRITVCVKRAGIPNNKAALKGMNCDSFKESVAFTVKPRISMLDKDGEKYGSEDSSSIKKYLTDVNIAGNNITFRNASVEGNIYITGNNSILNNISVTGKIVINPGREGNATLEDVKAKRIEVLSGGKNSIHIKNVKSDELYASSQDTVRIEVDGDTEIISVTAEGYIIFDKKSGTFGTIRIIKNESGETEVEFHGNIQDSVIVEGSARITTSEGSSIENLIISSENPESQVILKGKFNNVEINKKANVEIASGSDINEFEVKAEANIKVQEGANIKVLDTNNNNVNLDNKGNIDKRENTGGTNPPITGGGITVINVRGISVDIDSAVVKNGTSIKLSPIIYPSDASNSSVTWTSSNQEVASVDANGNVTANKEGSAVITVKSVDGAYTATTNIVVTKYDLTSKIMVSGSGIKLVINSSINNDEVTIRIIDEKAVNKYFDQVTMINGSGEIIVPIESGRYTCYMRGLGIDNPIAFTFRK